MTDAKVLQKAIDQAIGTGWGHDLPGPVTAFWIDATLGVHLESDGGTETLSWQAVAYNHDFAQALWGKEKLEFVMAVTPSETREATVVSEAWLYHLLEMVIADKPLQYLGRHL